MPQNVDVKQNCRWHVVGNTNAYQKNRKQKKEKTTTTATHKRQQQRGASMAHHIKERSRHHTHNVPRYTHTKKKSLFDRFIEQRKRDFDATTVDLLPKEKESLFPFCCSGTTFLFSCSHLFTSQCTRVRRVIVKQRPPPLPLPSSTAFFVCGFSTRHQKCRIFTTRP